MVSVSPKDGMRLTCLDSIEEGKKIRFKFEMGSIDHPVFGQSENLEGEYELFHSKGSYPISSYFHLTKQEQEDILESKVAKFRQLFGHLSEEDLRTWLKTMLITSALYCPHLEPKSKMFEFMSDAVPLGFQIDDIFEDNPGFNDIGFFYQTMTKGGQDLAGLMMSPTKRKLFFNRIAKLVDNTEHVTGATENHFADAESEQLAATQKWAKTAIFGIETMVLCQSMYKNKLGFSEAAWKFIREYDAGIGALGEMCCSVRRFTVPKYIRKTILFELFLKGVRDFGGQLNDVLGLLKDLKVVENPPNIILRRILNENISIDESFNQLLNTLLGTIEDLKVVGKLLREAFPDDRNLAGYIESSFDLCDGQTLMYLVMSQLNSRYGSIKMKLVPV